MRATFGGRTNQRAVGDGIDRRPRTRVRSWTGRAANSLSTDSAVPTFVTAGTRRTRVSEMRLDLRIGAPQSHCQCTGPAIRTSARAHGKQSGIQCLWSG